MHGWKTCEFLLDKKRRLLFDKNCKLCIVKVISRAVTEKETIYDEK